MTALPDTPNRDQAANWNADNGRLWVELQGVLDAFLAPVAAGLLDEAFPGEGARVLDIGCGAGATTLAMARRVGPTGRCMGLDISEPMAEAARARARTDGASTVSFIVADAQTHGFEPKAFDAAISRFGVMFFDDPTGAFANIRRALRPGGKLTFVAWRGPDENPFMTASGRVARTFIPDLPRPDLDAPGQFAFARAERIRDILSGAGWTSVETRPWNVPAAIAERDLPSLARMGPAGAAMRALPEPRRAEAIQAVLAAYGPFVRSGAARFDLACWLVTARA